MKQRNGISTMCLIEAAHLQAQQYRITKKNTVDKKITVLMEEIGEICEAVQENNRAEIVQETADACIVLFLILKHYATSDDEIYRCMRNSIGKLK